MKSELSEGFKVDGFYIKAWEKKLQEEAIADDIFGYTLVYLHLKTIWEKFIWWFVWKIHAPQRRRAEEDWYSREFTVDFPTKLKDHYDNPIADLVFGVDK